MQQDEGYPSDFFCYGMPGNTLPLGNWDPWGLHQVSPEIVRRYRESEIKHGRLAMLGVVGFLLQEQHHPRHQDLGGLAITHMQQLSTNMFSFGGLSTEFGIMGSGEIDFVMVISTLCLFEILALTRNWDVTRGGNTCYHQFFDVLGIGKLKSVKSTMIMMFCLFLIHQLISFCTLLFSDLFYFNSFFLSQNAL